MSEPTDDAQTRIVGKDADAGAALPVGYRLHEYEIECVIGEGGFGIVYRARDAQLERRVAIKEYMPGSLASRQRDLGVAVKSERYRETFELGRRSFITEARLLAMFDHPCLVKVYRYWEQNGTAYMVMPYCAGPTLKQWLRERPQPPDEAWLKQMLDGLLAALAKLHAENCFHRDIAPDNVILLQGERPVLLDFGAARRVIGEMTQALTVILKPGYAPIEQYAEVQALKQGPFTDIYALAAVLYYAITGRAPVPSVGRMVNDDLSPASVEGAGRYSPAFLAAIDAGLRVRPEDRPPDVARFRALLFAGAAPPEPLAAGAPAKRRVPWWAMGVAAAVVVLALVGAIAVWHDTPAPAVAQPEQHAAAPVPAPAAVTPPASVAPAATPPEPAPPAAAADDAVALLREVYALRATDVGVQARTKQAQLRINRDRLRFVVRSNRAGFVYVLMAGTDEKHLYLLFPNAKDRDNRLAADTDLTLPRTGWDLDASGPPGTDRIVVLVSVAPRRFDYLAPVELLNEFQLNGLRAARRSGSVGAVAAGQALCAATSDPCDTRYGAAWLEMVEVAQ